MNALLGKLVTPILRADAPRIIAEIETDINLKALWSSYQKKYQYAAAISFEDVIESTKVLADKAG